MAQSKKRNSKHDYTLLAALLLLIIMGLVILYSTSAYNGEVKFHDSFYYLKKQAFAMLLGIAGMFVVANMDYHWWRHVAVLGYFTAILLSVAVLFVGDEYNGSKRWLSLGPFSFQPSEFAKVAVILFLAHVITKDIKNMGKMRTMIKVMAMILPIVGLVGASNLSTAIIILGIGVILVFVASPKYGQFVFMGLLGIGFMTIFLALERYDLLDYLRRTGTVRGRICLNPVPDPYLEIFRDRHPLQGLVRSPDRDGSHGAYDDPGHP